MAQGRVALQFAIVSQFEDLRFRELGEQLIYFESPGSLNADRREIWQRRVTQRLLGTGEPCEALTLPDALQQANDLISNTDGDERA